MTEMAHSVQDKSEAFLPRFLLQSVLDCLQQQGYECHGPVVEHHAIKYQKVTHVKQFPDGVLLKQEPGKYRLNASQSGLKFSWSNGAQGIKPFVFKPRQAIWSAQKKQGELMHFSAPQEEKALIAVLGMRACDLAALDLLDRHFLQGEFTDPLYARYREQLFIVAANCTHPADTCFCASTGDGPAVGSGYDLLLTEISDGYILQPGSTKGEAVYRQLPLITASKRQLRETTLLMQETGNKQTHHVPPKNMQKILENSRQSEHWQEIAARCLSCGNCTMVCPTCFCHCHEQESSLDGGVAVQYRSWDSCFSNDHSYIHGTVIREQTAHRYRQWLSHKFGTWHEQYGRSGCVGCGRCITWCPVGIDVTQELNWFQQETNNKS